MMSLGDAVYWLAEKLRRNTILPDQIPRAPQLTRPAGSTEDSRPIVLLVDDERTFVDTYAIILQQTGYRPLKAYSGEQALEIMQQVRPDLVFADINMGWVNGVEVAMAAKQRWPDCAVLLVTGHYSNMRFLEPAEAAGYHFEVVGRGHPRELLEKFAGLLGNASSPPEAV